MRGIRRAPGAIVLVLVLVGCTTSAATAAASVPFPVAVGNTWTYKITGNGESGTSVSKMTAVKPVAGGQQVTMTTSDDLGGTRAASTEAYLFHSDGSISYPLGELSPGSGVTMTSTGVVWPPAAVIDSGKPSQSAVRLSIKASGQTITTTAHITVQGAGTATVTVPAGTYQATVVVVTEKLDIEGVAATVQVRTWLAPNVGPVQSQVSGTGSGTTSIGVNEQLESFTKG